MGKELVVSANRHETKVAILEDDQLVEIFFQRANEYSLAGSIHKGRVTRVLPGMQSAFVDLGLERDTFLYVSDFFEENEEYEALPGDDKGRRSSPREERPERPERTERADRPERTERNDRPERSERPERNDRPERSERSDRPERNDRPERVEPVAPSAVQASSSPAPSAAAPVASHADGRQDDANRGRRSRRRRGRGRGFPDSKYASDTAVGEEAVAETEVPREPEPAEDIILLPGESLAKYSRPAHHEAHVAAEPEADTEPDTDVELEADEEATELETVAEATPVEEPVAPAVEPEPEAIEPVAATEEPEATDAASDLDDAILDRVEAAEAEAEEEEERALAAGPYGVTDVLDTENTPAEEPEVDAPVLRLDPAGDLIEEQLLAAASVDEVTITEDAEVEGDEFDSDEPAEASAESATGEPGDVEADSETPEPARIPQSLTATLREQGGRYPHRSSRRMRRRRGGYEGRGDGQSTPGGPSARPPQEAAAPVVAAPREERAAPREERSSPREDRTVTRPDKPAPTVSITDLLKEGQEILVQIAKEPLGQKGARITSHIALPGRYVVYMPTVDHLGVSRKIGTDEERLRLKRILQTHRIGIPGGYIMRTAGEGKSEEEIAADMKYLSNLWLDIRQKADKRPAPALLHHDLDIVQRILRDQFAENFKAIWVDNEDLYESILNFVQRFQPALVGRVKMYTRPIPIFDSFNITTELEKALRPKVWLKSGGYIVINQTEALVAIDVNTGKYVGKSNRLEDTIVKTNTEAVKEIVRQIRLRDLGGIIVVDFIDMDERKNRQKVMQTLEDAMRADKAPNKILQFNDFGLVAITRKRVKQSLERTLCAPCPHCEGAGYVKSVSTVVGEILQEAAKIAGVVEGKDCMLRVNPEVAKYLKSTENKYLEELEGTLGRPVLVVSDGRLHQEKFDLT